MDNLTREEKIDLLKKYQAGKPVEFPADTPSSCWEYRGELYIKLDCKTHEPHKSKTQLIAIDFTEQSGKNPSHLYIVFDSTIELGDISKQDNIVRAGVI